MWRVTINLLFHRSVLFAVALFALNLGVSRARQESSFKLHAFSDLWGRLLARVEALPEHSRLREVEDVPAGKIFSASQNPYVWLGRWLQGVTGFSAAIVLLILSNILLLLFLSELYGLLNQMTLPEISALGAVLMIFWVSSYELSLGSSVGLNAFLIALILRHALDNRWILTGLGFLCLGLTDLIMVGMLPLLVFIFVYFQRHFQMAQVVKRACFFLVPLGFVFWLRWEHLNHISGILEGSALMGLYRTVVNDGLQGLLSTEVTGQVITLSVFLVGALLAMLSNTTFLHRAIPVYMWLLLGLFSPLRDISSRAPFAAVCLQGIALVSSPMVGRLILMILLVGGAYEVFSIFSGA